MQHRAYQPILPCGNKYLQHKWDKSHYEMHKKKLEEERMGIIQRDNELLLEKIAFIMRTTGRIDNRNYYESRSLCREKRQQELLRVTKENQIIVERLSRCESRYSAKQWHEDWLRMERYRESIARYPRSKSLTEAQTKFIKKEAKEGRREKSDKEKNCSGGDQSECSAPSDGSNSIEKTETDTKKSV
ncbi:hypothetical protein JZ751_028026 [Albula glossodonta]|uniref:Cilia- and flagella-associated protein 97 n=1 Tax=Albula glossodonta TaxID=121402 RepID=A0A8T2PJA2_9TELE|nr:hypothetical protein JZ751_028026 [Albula glossodonta]